MHRHIRRIICLAWKPTTVDPLFVFLASEINKTPASRTQGKVVKLMGLENSLKSIHSHNYVTFKEGGVI